MGSSGAATRFWMGRELRTRWRSLVVLGLLAGLAAGVASAAVAGARRTDTAYDRWRIAIDAPDAIVFGTQVTFPDNPDYAAVKELPEVRRSGAFSLSPVALEGYELESLPPVDRELYRTIGRPLLEAGRLPDPKRADEVLINRAAAKATGLHVGSRVTLQSADDLDAFFGIGEFDGPEQPATVVGIGDSPIDQILLPDQAGFAPSPAFLDEHPEVPVASNLLVQLRPGTSVTSFHENVVEAMQIEDVPVRDLAEDAKRFTHGTDLERTALLLFAVAALAAGLVLVGQAMSRVVYAVAEAAPTLRAMGFTRGQLVSGLVVPLALAAATGAVVTVVLGAALSSLFPIGLASQLEPDPGFHVDVAALLAGAALIALATISIATVAALRATSARGAGREQGSFVVRRVRRVMPLPIAIGAGMALERGRGERSLPVWPAIAGAVAAVVGIVGALGLVAGIDDALAERARSGQAWDLEVFIPEPGGAQPGLYQVEEVVRASRELAGLDKIVQEFRVPLEVGGAGTALYSLEPIRGDVTFALLRGRAPASSDEIALGPATASALALDVGDQVTVAGRRGVRARVVGIALLPQTPHTSFDQGGWMTPKGLRALATSAGGSETYVGLSFHGDADVEAARSSLARSLPAAEMYVTSTPQDVLLLKNVRTLPRMLALFLALLGIAAVGHVLVTAVRRRRHDIAVLRAVGFSPSQAAACIAWQATIVGIVGLAIGVPLGIVTGRLAWRWVADNTPLLYVGPIAIAAVLLIIPATLLIANMLAALPARRAALIRPASVLRTE